MAGVDALITLTDRMVEAARRGEWDELQSLSAVRQNLLAAYRADSDEAAGLARLKRIDDTLLEIARGHRDELGRSLGKRQQRAAAVRAYHQTY